MIKGTDGALMKNGILLSLALVATLVTCAPAQVIDPLISTATWIAYGDTNGDTASRVAANITRDGINLTYMLSGGSWAVISNDCTSLNFLDGDSVRFLYKGDGTDNDLHVQLVDRDGTVSVAVLPHALAHTEWTEETLNLPYMTDGDFPYAGYVATGTVIGSGLPFSPQSAAGQQSLDRQRILAMGFVESSVTWNSGSFTIDNIRLMSHGKNLIYVEDFDGVPGTNKIAPNIMVGTTPVSVNGAFNSTAPDFGLGYCAAARVTQAASGNAALRLDYDVTNASSFSGFFTNLVNTDISRTKFLSFKVRGFSGGEKFNIKLRPNPVTAHVSITDYVTVSQQWQQVLIPLTDFVNLITTGSLSGGTTTSNADQLIFEFNHDLLAPFSGTIYLDDIKFVNAAMDDAALVSTIDGMDDQPNALGPWQRFGDYANSLASVPGASGRLGDNAVRFDYSYNPAGAQNNNGWAALQRYLKPNFTQINSFSFKYAGTGGPDDIEFNVKDLNGVSYCRKFFGVSNTGGQWVSATVPINELALLVSSGTTKTLDLRNIAKVELGISRGGASSGRGSVAFKDLENSDNSLQSASGNAVLDSLQVPDNPFSPNGDGLKDKARFIYKLKQSATVKLEIYALKGERVRRIEAGNIGDLDVHVIEWDGTDDSGTRVNNGLYLYRFFVDNNFGQTDKVINLIGVIR